jgi:heme O synthase-like polyprenyltransferase
MNYHTLAKFILVLGLIVAGFGGVKFAANQPVTMEAPKMASNTLAAMAEFANSMGNAAAADDENMARHYERAQSAKIMGGGTVLIFAAIAVMKSVRKNNPDVARNPT